MQINTYSESIAQDGLYDNVYFEKEYEMKKKVLLLTALSCGLVFVSSCTKGHKQSSKKLVSLFNGKDLTGWTGAVDCYSVEDGKIVCMKGCAKNLFTEAEYSNFKLQFEFNLTPGANNGLAIRAPLKGRSSYEGMEVQIIDNKDYKRIHNYSLKPWQYHGSLYGIAAAKQGFLKPAGQWNFQEVTANGRQITVNLNGKTILDVNLDEIDKTADGNEHPGMKRTKGHIGFLGHGDRVEFRNIRLAELP